MLILGGLLLIVLASLITYLISHQYYQRKLRQTLKVNGGVGPAMGKDLFDQVSQRIKDLEKQVEQWSSESSRQGKHLEGLLQISESSQRQDSPTIIYDKILDVILDVTGFSSGGIHLLEPGEKFVYLVASKGIPDLFLQALDTENLDRSYMQPLSKREPYSTEEYTPGAYDVPEALVVDDIVREESIKIPLLAGERFVGTLTIFNIKGPKRHLDADQRWLESIGRQLGILINHMRISERLQNIAVLQERERISQELHDNLSQFVGTIRLLSEQIVISSKSENVENIKRDAEAIESIARIAYANIRDEMVGLRFIQNLDQEIVSALREYLERFERQWNIAATLEIKNLEEPHFISPSVGIQLLRIMQEALTNVRRHAHATQVVVIMEKMHNQLLVRIKDNGIGFDSEATFDNRLGLRIVRERAISLGGSLQIISSPETGTLVQVELPMKIESKP
jgi:two-component system nitrate/nitrite sensor histidine kinase NarX